MRAGDTDRSRFWLRVLFSLDIFGAGGPGLLMLVAPRRAGEWLFDGRLAPDAGTPVLGCIWLSLGLLAVAGLFRPVRFIPVLLVQFGYKLLWLAAIGLPAVVAGRAIPPVLFAIFVGWVAAVGFAAPWRTLFGPDDSDRRKSLGLATRSSRSRGADPSDDARFAVHRS